MTSIYTMFVGPIMGKFLDYSHHIYRCTYLLASFGLTVLACWPSSAQQVHGSGRPESLRCTGVICPLFF